MLIEWAAVCKTEAFSTTCTQRIVRADVFMVRDSSEEVKEYCPLQSLTALNRAEHAKHKVGLIRLCAHSEYSQSGWFIF